MLDKEIIRKVKNGDRKAFDAFCVEFYAGLISYARVFLSEEWAEDVVQDVLYSVWQKRDTLKEEDSVRSYLFRSVHNCALNYLKLQRHSDDFREWNKKRIAELALSSSDWDSNAALRKLYAGDLRERLTEAIEGLSSRQSEIFRLSYMMDLSSKEIGERLGISPRTVESHLYEALKYLRARLLSGGDWIPISLFWLLLWLTR